jgi:hypothetical protein
MQNQCTANAGTWCISLNNRYGGLFLGSGFSFSFPRIFRLGLFQAVLAKSVFLTFVHIYQFTPISLKFQVLYIRKFQDSNLNNQATPLPHFNYLIIDYCHLIILLEVFSPDKSRQVGKQLHCAFCGGFTANRPQPTSR